uniref:Uncharacterized protein n=1 Tax=Oryza punctata TaxID=4537 RepID=A0A0E0M5F0_ORYPU
MDQVFNNLKQKLNIPSNIADYKMKGKSKVDDVKPDSSSRFSVKYFSEVLAALTPHHKIVISNSCFHNMLHFEQCFVPNSFAIWIANQVDINSSDIIVRDKVIPLNRESVHIVLGLPLGGKSIHSNSDLGKRNILDSFAITTIPSVKFFGAKLINNEDLSDEQILIKLDKSKTFGGCLFYLAVNYLDFLNFGLRKIPSSVPRIKVWKNSMIKDHAKFDKISDGIYGRRPVKDISSTCYEK